MFDIILDNLVAPKYKFKLFHAKDEILEYEELKKLAKMSKYQKNEYLKENRITKNDEFFAKFDPNVKQYNYLGRF